MSHFKLKCHSMKKRVNICIFLLLLRTVHFHLLNLVTLPTHSNFSGAGFSGDFPSNHKSSGSQHKATTIGNPTVRCYNI